MLVREVMTKSVTMVDSSATLIEAAETMRDQDIGAVPVADAGRPIGMLTDRDMVVGAIADHKDPAQTRVRDVMTPRLATVYEDQDVRDAAAVMAQQQVRRLLVLDHDKSPVGILSLGDIGRSEASGSQQALRGVSEPHRELEAQRGSKP